MFIILKKNFFFPNISGIEHNYDWLVDKFGKKKKLGNNLGGTPL